MGISSANFQRPRSTSYSGSASTTSTTYTTLLNVVGKGRLVNLNFLYANSSYASWQITIDGSVIFNLTALPTSTATNLWVTPIYNGGLNSKPTANYTTFNVGFKNGLKIEAYTSNSSYSIRAGWLYELE